MSDPDIQTHASASDSGGIPLIVTAPDAATDSAAWFASQRDWIDDALLEHGALLFRGFPMGTEQAFDMLATELFGERLAYVYRSTPRTSVGKNIYTTTEYPADEHIPLHNENAYQRDWPLRLAFCCLQAAASGGQTPLADTGRVTLGLPEALIDRFRERGVMYVRNYYDYLDLPWQTVFQTEDKAEMEAFCEARDIEVHWKPDGGLRTVQRAQALATHPRVGRELWFNQAHLFHVSALDADTRSALTDLFPEEDLPRNAFYGDGTPISESDLSEIRGAFEREKVMFDWKAGDVLLLDNMLVSHGRAPFTGQRRVLAALGEACSSNA